MVTLYTLDTTRLNPNLTSYRGLIPDARMTQLSGLPQPAKALGLAAELLFQRAVQRHCPQISLPALRVPGPGGKPYLPGCPAFHFNLSHSGLWAVCAVADTPVGVDIEQVRPVSLKLSRKFSPQEQQAIFQAPPQVQLPLFFDLWVQKEAFTKCTGQGLLCPFSRFQGADPDPRYRVQLVEFPDPSYRLAVCVQDTQLPPVQLVMMPA